MSITDLRIEATKSVEFRGHVVPELKDWKQLHKPFSKKMSFRYTCPKCGRGVTIQTHPAPNGIDIGGEAVALGCGDEL